MDVLMQIAGGVAVTEPIPIAPAPALAEAEAKPPPAKKKKKQQQQAADKPRHLPGYSLLRIERDRIDRVRATIKAKIDKRKTVSVGVCSILNDQLLKFYDGMRDKFEQEFGKYVVDEPVQ